MGPPAPGHVRGPFGDLRPVAAVRSGRRAGVRRVEGDLEPDGGLPRDGERPRTCVHSDEERLPRLGGPGEGRGDVRGGGAGRPAGGRPQIEGGRARRRYCEERHPHDHETGPHARPDAGSPIIAIRATSADPPRSPEGPPGPSESRQYEGRKAKSAGTMLDIPCQRRSGPRQAGWWVRKATRPFVPTAAAIASSIRSGSRRPAWSAASSSMAPSS